MEKTDIKCAKWLLMVAICLYSCKSSRTVTTSERIKTTSENIKPSEQAATKSTYPASEYYGNNWNNQHIRLNADPKPKGTTTLSINERFVMPVCGNVLSEFGPRSGSMHTGIDLKLQMNDPVYCAFDGMVRMAQEYGDYGKMVVVRHENGLETLYSHLNTISVKVNQRLKAGDRIGGGGKTGRATGTHLHFETRFKGEPFNPRLVVNVENCTLKAGTLALSEKSYSQYGKNLTASNQKETQTTPKTTERTQSVVTHTVQKGDTLYNISRRYDTTVDTLRRLNQLSESSAIQIGQKLIVK